MTELAIAPIGNVQILRIAAPQTAFDESFAFVHREQRARTETGITFATGGNFRHWVARNQARGNELAPNVKRRNVIHRVRHQPAIATRHQIFSPLPSTQLSQQPTRRMDWSKMGRRHDRETSTLGIVARSRYAPLTPAGFAYFKSPHHFPTQKDRRSWGILEPLKAIRIVELAAGFAMLDLAALRRELTTLDRAR
jgi:hypothetical protein